MGEEKGARKRRLHSQSGRRKLTREEDEEEETSEYMILKSSKKVSQACEQEERRIANPAVVMGFLQMCNGGRKEKEEMAIRESSRSCQMFKCVFVFRMRKSHIRRWGEQRVLKEEM